MEKSQSIKVKEALRAFLLKYLPTTLFVILGSAFLIFPFNDLIDLVSTQVSKNTGGRVYLQFEELGLNLVPQPGAELVNVNVETAWSPNIKIDNLSISPSPGILPTYPDIKPFGSLNATGIFGGNLKIHTSKAKKTENGADQIKIEIDGENLSLEKIKEVANLPVPLQGSLSLTTEAVTTYTMEEQPEAELNVVVSKFLLPATSVNTPLGPFPLPEIKMDNVTIKGRLAGGTFILENGTFGKTTDPVNATLKGKMGVTLTRDRMGNVIPQFGSYNFELILNVKSDIEKKLLFLTFIDQFKKPAPGGSQFRIKLSADRFGIAPQFDALR